MALNKNEKKVSDMLDALQTGQTLLVGAWKTKDPLKVQLEFAEKTRQVDSNPGALLALMNADDPRFSTGARRSWLTSSVSQVGKMLNINVGDDAGWELNDQRDKEGIFLGVLNPKIMGKRIRVIISETLVPNEYQAKNLQTSAKRKGAEGEFIKHNGKYIFSNTDVALVNEGDTVEHVLLQPDASSVVVVTDKISDEVGD